MSATPSSTQTISSETSVQTLNDANRLLLKMYFAVIMLGFFTLSMSPIKDISKSFGLDIAV